MARARGREGIAGYAYAGEHRERLAYQWSVDVSCYVHPRARGRGIGKALYHALLRVLRAQGFCNAFAGIALPNEASVALHESVGFTPLGRYRNVGFKLGAWRDSGWWQCAFGEPARESAGRPAAVGARRRPSEGAIRTYGRIVSASFGPRILDELRRLALEGVALGEQLSWRREMSAKWRSSTSRSCVAQQDFVDVTHSSGSRRRRSNEAE